MPTPSFQATHFRFRNDDGNETNASWLAAQDTSAAIVVPGSGTKIVRLRFVVESINGTTNSGAMGLLVSRNSGSFATVNVSSSYVRGGVSANLTNGANTTEQLSASGTYVTEAGVINNTSASSGTIPSLLVSHCTEFEWALALQNASLSVGDTLDFNLSNTGNPAIQFGSSVRLTVTSNSFPIHGNNSRLNATSFYLGSYGVTNL